MRFKVDENLPIDVAEILRANNHDAMTIFDQEMVSTCHPRIWIKACKSGSVDGAGVGLAIARAYIRPKATAFDLMVGYFGVSEGGAFSGQQHLK
jgi:hypothetical protein